MRILTLAAALLGMTLAGGCAKNSGGEEVRRSTMTTIDQRSADMEQIEHAERKPRGTADTATFGAGCFWCVEAVFESIDGVTGVKAGYAGGTVENPSYEAVCSGSTGHAEVAQVTFDPGLVRFEELLAMFWRSHDPTTLNRQGADVGTQYRSAIFYHNEEQRTLAEQSKRAAQQYFDDPIVTEITPLDRFWVAENYHQDYYRNNRNAPYCQVVIAPKLRKLDLE